MKRKSSTSSAFFSPRALLVVLLCAATACFVVIPIRSGLAFHQPQASSSRFQRPLTFEERVSYQRAIEDVYWRHRIWPRENSNPKPSLDTAMSQAQIEKKVADYLRSSEALEDYWQRPITPEQLQAEMDRMAKHTKQPEVLQELFDALGNDSFVIAECLARPALAERLLTNCYAYDQRIHGELKQRAEAQLQGHPGIGHLKQLGGKYSEIEFARSGTARRKDNRDLDHRMTLNDREWEETVQKLAATFNKPASRLLNGRDPAGAGSRTLDSTASYKALPVGRPSSLQEDEIRYYATAILSKTKDSLKLATVSWLKEPFEFWRAKAESQVRAVLAVPNQNYTLPEVAGGGCIDDTWIATAGPPEGRQLHTAIWTGSEMIVWGGELYSHLSFASGGRYDPSTDTWMATSAVNSPAARAYHSAVWTGNEMIVWGGGFGGFLNTGSRYDPGTNSWTATSTINAPSGRLSPTAVWTGTEMIVWGGFDGDVSNTGGRYNPNTDTWSITSVTNAPDPRTDHTAVWTGGEMIVWGGQDTHGVTFNTGGRYNPDTNSWTPTSTSNVPDSRFSHTAVWTGDEMIVWGGLSFGYWNTGGRYNPTTNTWAPTSIADAPSARSDHTAIWTGSEMIVWGGFPFDSTGGRYNPSTNSWLATSQANAPGGRQDLTAVWTGSEMIVWGGYDFDSDLNTGGRYDPSADSWVPTGNNGAPAERFDHTAVWTGSEMIVWGGATSLFSSNRLNTGGSYGPATNNWTATSTTNAPDSRSRHTAVWTGSEMIVWGGQDENSIPSNTGGRYNPNADSWLATSTASAPDARYSHTAIWTGSEMIVWGGNVSGNGNTGGRYNPSGDSWVATSVANAPSTRVYHTAVWTGSDMIVWGGFDGLSTFFNSGGRYNPSSDNWTTTNVTNAASARASHTAVWTGSEMIVWGGFDNSTTLDTGGRYDPVTNSWAATSTTGAPVSRESHTATWSGSEMIVWGGTDFSFQTFFDTGGRYNASADEWTATSPTNAPAGRSFHTAVWTGSDMIVWGGASRASTDNTGGQYCAQSGPTPTPTPAPRVTPRPRPSPHARPTPP
jgi:N-acetylneuraminic acid mutarotase